MLNRLGTQPRMHGSVPEELTGQIVVVPTSACIQCNTNHGATALPLVPGVQNTHGDSRTPGLNTGSRLGGTALAQDWTTRPELIQLTLDCQGKASRDKTVRRSLGLTT